MEDQPMRGQPLEKLSVICEVGRVANRAGRKMMKSFVALFSGLLSCLALSATLWAGQADVLSAEVRRSADGSFRFSVTLRHDDTGWEHYAERW
jgi:hypothetical protein|tara:strand:+ start:1311 stop:1589 length:279 start_codon:yes stop_codon:yes gene_type:complete